MISTVLYFIALLVKMCPAGSLSKDAIASLTRGGRTAVNYQYVPCKTVRENPLEPRQRRPTSRSSSLNNAVRWVCSGPSPPHMLVSFTNSNTNTSWLLHLSMPPSPRGLQNTLQKHPIWKTLPLLGQHGATRAFHAPTCKPQLWGPVSKG